MGERGCVERAVMSSMPWLAPLRLSFPKGTGAFEVVAWVVTHPASVQ